MTACRLAGVGCSGCELSVEASFLLRGFLSFTDMFHIFCIDMQISFLGFQIFCLPCSMRSRRSLLILLFRVLANLLGDSSSGVSVVWQWYSFKQATRALVGMPRIARVMSAMLS